MAILLKRKKGLELGTTGSPNGMSTKNVVSNLKKKKQRKRIMLLSVAGVILLVAALAIVNSQKEVPIVVQTEQASRHSIIEVVQATGKVEPELQVKLSPEVSGEIINLPIREGDEVTAGQLIAKIRPTAIEAQYEQAQASVDASKARLEQSRANLIAAKSEYNRSKDLLQKKLLSQQEFEGIESRYQSAEALFNAGKFEVSSSESQLKLVSESLRKTAVVAPMSGTVTTLNSQLGERVVGTSSFSGTEMMTISDLSVMNAEVEVDENDVIHIHKGDKAKLTIDAYPNKIFEGEVVEIANSAKLAGAGQEQSTNFDVKIRIKNVDEVRLRPGMSTTAKIETAHKENILAVPITAVTRRFNPTPAQKDTTIKARANVGKSDSVGSLTADSGQAGQPASRNGKREQELPIVFVIVNGKVKAVPVQTGISDNSYIEITSGLKGDEEIVKGNYSAVNKLLEDGKAIKIDNTSSGYGTSANGKPSKAE